MDSTKPASRSTRRCFDTVGCVMRSCRSISPTDCCDETSRLNSARRFGSAMISNTDSMLLIYSITHIRVKVYLGSPGNGFSRDAGMSVGQVIVVRDKGNEDQIAKLFETIRVDAKLPSLTRIAHRDRLEQHVCTIAHAATP